MEGWGDGGVGRVGGCRGGRVEGWGVGHVVRAHSGILVVAYFGFVAGSVTLTSFAETFEQSHSS